MSNNTVVKNVFVWNNLASVEFSDGKALKFKPHYLLGIVLGIQSIELEDNGRNVFTYNGRGADPPSVIRFIERNWTQPQVARYIKAALEYILENVNNPDYAKVWRMLEKIVEFPDLLEDSAVKTENHFID